MESKLLTIHFPLPEGYKSADQYLKSIVEEQIQKRYDNTIEGLDERLLRAKSAVLRQDLKEYERNIIADLLEFASALNLAKEELASIKKKQLADRYLMIWDYVQAVRNKGFIVGCDRNLNADN